MNNKRKIAIMVATSGHSGVDTIIKNLIHGFCNKEFRVDLLKVKNHGPYGVSSYPELNVIEFPFSHVNSCLFSLARYLRREQPDVLLTDKYKVNRLAAMAKIISFVSTRLVFRIGTTVSEDLKSRGSLEKYIHQLSFKLLYPMADSIIFPSRGAAEDFAGLNKKLKTCISFIPNPIISSELYELACEEIDHPWIKNKELPVIIGVGELSRRKNFELLLQAFSNLRKELPCRLLILGEGRQRNYLENLIYQLGIEKDVDMPGFKENPYPYMAGSDLLVLSSLYEGAGIVLIEALGLGLPVLSTSCPSGPEEILDHGRYGRLVSMNDPKDMAEAIIDTLNNPPSSEFQKQGSMEYHRDNSVQKYLEAFGLE